MMTIARTDLNRVTALSCALAALFLPACSGESASGQGDNGSGPAAGPTYYADAKPILDAKCAGCHTPGGIAPFSLQTYAEAEAQKAAIAAAVTSGTMPPWPPSADCAEYLGNRSLTQDQIDTLTAWIDAGAQEGDPGAEAPPLDGTRTLSRTDLTLSIPEPYTPVLSPDEYRCFVVDWPAAEQTFVTGFGVKPGAASIVHHVIAYLATPETVATFEELDASDPGPGYSCFGGAGGGKAAWIGGWAPGALGADFPAGTGIEIPPGSKVILQIHYNTSTAEPEPDQSSIVLKVDPTVEKKAFVMPWTNPSWIVAKTMDIPAHSTDVTHSWEIDPTKFIGGSSGGAVAPNTPFTIYTAGLHMHTRGTHARTEIHGAGGASQCLLEIPSWNFHWQGSYELATPATLSPGDSLYLECHWDNAGPTDINWGEGTGDEMCLGTFFITQ